MYRSVASKKARSRRKRRRSLVVSSGTNGGGELEAELDEGGFLPGRDDKEAEDDEDFANELEEVGGLEGLSPLANAENVEAAATADEEGTAPPTDATTGVNAVFALAVAVAAFDVSVAACHRR